MVGVGVGVGVGVAGIWTVTLPLDSWIFAAAPPGVETTTFDSVSWEVPAAFLAVNVIVANVPLDDTEDAPSMNPA